MKQFARFILLVAFITAPLIAAAHSYQQGDIRIGHIWARATPSGATTGAVYVPLLNTGKIADRLIGVTTTVAAKAEIHDMQMQNNIMKMQKLDGVDLPPNAPVALRPGGMHIMLFGLKQPLQEGSMIPLTLQFANAGSITVDVMIEKPGATSAQDD